jgi:Ca-activated chloride channel family protein
MVMGCFLLAIAIAGPRWGREDAQLAGGRDIVVVADLSRSMQATDVAGASVMTRAEAARAGIRGLVDQMEKQGGHRLALVGFAARAQVLCPLTHDYDHFREALNGLDPDNGLLDIGPASPDDQSGTRMGAALRQAAALHDDRLRGSQEIVLLSDGDDPLDDGEWRAGVASALTKQVPIHVVGVGDPASESTIRNSPARTKLHEEPLRAIAASTGGTYVASRTSPIAADRLYAALTDRKPMREHEEPTLPSLRGQATWFWSASLLCLSTPFLVGVMGRRDNSRFRAMAAVVLLCAAVSVSASPAERADQYVARGNAAYAAGDFTSALDWYARAEERTRDPGMVAFNKAAAFYRLGRFGEAEAHYRRCLESAAPQRRVQALFNLGNCIARQAADEDVSQWESAVAAYDECLAAGPADPLATDALHNQAVAQAFLDRARAARSKSQADSGRPGDRPARPNAEGDDTDSAGSEVARERPDQAADASGKPRDSAVLHPGKGNLLSPPDPEGGTPLNAEHTKALIERVAERVRRERDAEHRAKRPMAGRQFLDW